MISSISASIGAKRLSALPVIGVAGPFLSSLPGAFLSGFCECAGLRANSERQAAAASSHAARPGRSVMAEALRMAGSVGRLFVLAPRRGLRFFLLRLAGEGLGD